MKRNRRGFLKSVLVAGQLAMTSSSQGGGSLAESEDTGSQNSFGANPVPVIKLEPMKEKDRFGVELSHPDFPLAMSSVFVSQNAGFVDFGPFFLH